MITHLLKLVWHRKRANALVIAEIFASFLIVFAVVTLAVSLLSRWGAPLGFSWQDVWTVQVDPMMTQEEHSSMRTTPGIPKEEIEKAKAQGSLIGRIVRDMQTYPELEAVAADSMTPYTDRNWMTMLSANGRNVFVTGDQASDDYARVMRIPILKGRWFTREDEAQNYVPVVLDSDAVRALFGNIDPIGYKFPADRFIPGDTGERKEFRVIGVIPPFRENGELSDNDTKMVFMRTSFINTLPPEPGTVVFRVKPGTPASFEADLNNRLRRVAGGSFHIRRMEEIRHSALKLRFVPVAALAIVAVFLISMVALGLTGVLWQTVTRRMREIGLRRAVGATGTGVRRQVLGEVALLSTLSIIAGAIVVLQLPVLGAFRIVTPREFTAGFAAALAVIYGITMLCGAYPSWLASTIEPAEALRYE